jgi:hypothetical protein
MSKSLDPEIFKLSSFIQNDCLDDAFLKAPNALKSSYHTSNNKKKFVPSPSTELIND